VRNVRFARLGLTLLAGASVLALALGLQQPAAKDRAAPAAEAPSGSLTPLGRTVHALARLEPAGGLIAVGARPGLRVERLLVGAGDAVKRGDVLAILEGHDQAQQQLGTVEAKSKAAADERARRRRQAALEREGEDRVLDVRLDALETSHQGLQDQAKTLGETLKNLPQAASLSDRLTLTSTLQQFQAKEAEARIELERARAERDLRERKRALEDEALGDAAAEPLNNAEVALARSGVEAATVRAPADGQVFEVATRAGETGQGLLLYLGDPGAMVARAEVDQDDMPEVQLGDPAEVTIHGTRVTGRVIAVGRLVAPNQLSGFDPRARQDRRVLRVTIQLDESEPASRYVNMEVEVAINPQFAAPAAAR
jgi:HlyD family secretion protein